MITLTEEDEHRIREGVTRAIMSADERDAILQALAAIATARAGGGRYVHVTINGARWPVVRLA